MKLVKQDEKSFTFLLGKRERDLFVALLLRYPVLSAAHFGRRPPVQSDSPEADDDLLREALSDQQKENRRTLEQWLNGEGRFQEADRSGRKSAPPGHSARDEGCPLREGPTLQLFIQNSRKFSLPL